MGRFGIFFALCSFAVLVGLASTGSSTTTETSKSNGCDTRNIIEKPHADILKSKSVKNNSECSLDQSNMKGAVQIGEQPAALYLNKISNASTIPTVSLSDNYTKVVKYVKRIENREDDASPSNHKNRSDDILDLSNIILARLTRQAEKSNTGSSNPSSVKNIESENIGSSQERSNLEGDLGVAEDRYRFQYPYWNRGQFANQRYRANDRRESFRNYLKYPVFPGK
ncbi:hypothetical protein CAJAP_07280 [Camponotus japonicus]